MQRSADKADGLRHGALGVALDVLNQSQANLELFSGGQWLEALIHSFSVSKIVRWDSSQFASTYSRRPSDRNDRVNKFSKAIHSVEG